MANSDNLGDSDNQRHSANPTAAIIIIGDEILSGRTNHLHPYLYIRGGPRAMYLLFRGKHLLDVRLFYRQIHLHHCPAIGWVRE